jgi:hypothetical protein
MMDDGQLQRDYTALHPRGLKFILAAVRTLELTQAKNDTALIHTNEITEFSTTAQK